MNSKDHLVKATRHMQPYATGAHPVFHNVDSTERRRHPYSAICLIIRGGQPVGTGWLVSRSVIVTAAHVLDYATSCEIRLDGHSDLKCCAIRKLREPYDVDVSGSADDLACLVVEDIPSTFEGLTFTHSSTFDDGYVVGATANNELRWSPGKTYSAGNFIAFNGDSPDDGGFSGAPLFAGEKVIGVYLGSSSGSIPLATATEGMILAKSRNCALAINERISKFIIRLIEETEK